MLHGMLYNMGSQTNFVNLSPYRTLSAVTLHIVQAQKIMLQVLSISCYAVKDGQVNIKITLQETSVRFLFSILWVAKVDLF